MRVDRALRTDCLRRKLEQASEFLGGEASALTYRAKELDAESGEDEEKEQEEKAEVAHLWQRVRHRFEEAPHSFCSLEQLEHARYSQHSHHANDADVDRNLNHAELRIR